MIENNSNHSASFNLETDLDTQYANIQKQKTDALLEQLGHVLGNNEAAAQICAYIPELEESEHGNLEALSRFTGRIKTMIYNHDTSDTHDHKQEMRVISF